MWFFPLFGQTWQWAAHTGSAKTFSGLDIDRVHDMFVDSVGNSYFLVQYVGHRETVLCGIPIEHVFNNSGRIYALVSLNTEGELRWYKTLYGATEKQVSYQGWDTILSDSSPMQFARLGFDGEDLVLIASSRDQIRLTDGMGGDTLLPIAPYNPQTDVWGGVVFSNNDMTQDVILKIDTEGNIVWMNALNDIYPVPVVNTKYHGDIYPNKVTFDEEKNIHLIYSLQTHEFPTTLPTNNPTYMHHCVQLTAEGEHIETLPIRATAFADEYAYHNGKYHYFFLTSAGLSVEGAELAGTYYPSGLTSFWFRFSDRWELEDWKVLGNGGLYSAKLKGDDFYVALGNQLIKLNENGDTTHLTSIDGNASIREVTFIDDETLAIFCFTRRDEVQLGNLSVSFDSVGVFVALFHEPTREFYYLSPIAHCWPLGINESVGFQYLEMTPDLNLVGAGSFYAENITFGETNLESSLGGQDIFFAKFGWPTGTPVSWPTHPSTHTIVEHSLLEKVTLYPNPVQSTLTLQSEMNPMNMVVIYDLSGRQMLLEQCAHTNTLSINTSHLPAGMYIAKIFTQVGIAERKFMKGY